MLQLRFEGLGEAVEHDLHAFVGRSRRNVASGAPGEEERDNGVARLLAQPFLVELDRFVALSQRAVGEPQHPSGLGVPRAERRHLAVADHRLLGPPDACQQHAEIW